MIITVCASLKFHDQLVKLQAELEKLGHRVLMPEMVEGVDYWSQNYQTRVNAKKGLGLINKHSDRIEKSEAILVANYTKKEIENYIGANTFLEIGLAYFLKKKIFLLNPMPNQPYLIEELITMNPIVIHGKLELLK